MAQAKDLYLWPINYPSKDCAISISLNIEYLKSFKDQTKIKRMLSILGLSNLGELENIFNCLVDVKLDITAEEILD